MNRQSGVSLIELMVSIGIAALLLTLALPSFETVLRSNRVATASNLIVATLNFARSEALRSRDVAHVCPRGEEQRCGDDWTRGLMVWTDENRNKAMDAGELRRVVELTPAVSLRAADIDAELAFDDRGRLARAQTARFVVRADVCAAGAFHQRSISVSQIGRATVAREEC